MQFLLSVISDSTEPGSDAEQAAIDVFNQSLQDDGKWVFANGMFGPETSTTFDNRDDRGLVTDGPFVESKEFVAGFWIIEADDVDDARRLAAGASKACNRKIELRQFHAAPEA
jgi:hypothetical protein